MNNSPDTELMELYDNEQVYEAKQAGLEGILPLLLGGYLFGRGMQGKKAEQDRQEAEQMNAMFNELEAQRMAQLTNSFKYGEAELERLAGSLKLAAAAMARQDVVLVKEAAVSALPLASALKVPRPSLRRPTLVSPLETPRAAPTTGVRSKAPPSVRVEEAAPLSQAVAPPSSVGMHQGPYRNFPHVRLAGDKGYISNVPTEWPKGTLKSAPPSAESVSVDLGSMGPAPSRAPSPDTVKQVPAALEKPYRRVESPPESAAAGAPESLSPPTREAGFAAAPPSSHYPGAGAAPFSRPMPGEGATTRRAGFMPSSQAMEAAGPSPGVRIPKMPESAAPLTGIQAAPESVMARLGQKMEPIAAFPEPLPTPSAAPSVSPGPMSVHPQFIGAAGEPQTVNQPPLQGHTRADDAALKERVALRKMEQMRALGEKSKPVSAAPSVAPAPSSASQALAQLPPPSAPPVSGEQPALAAGMPSVLPAGGRVVPPRPRAQATQPQGPSLLDQQPLGDVFGSPPTPAEGGGGGEGGAEAAKKKKDHWTKGLLLPASILGGSYLLSGAMQGAGQVLGRPTMPYQWGSMQGTAPYSVNQYGQPTY
jgi:hypothetical protein